MTLQRLSESADCQEDIKRGQRDRLVRLLVCTDATGEGLNLQFAGVLVNYDPPWNPMKVEQRIGRIVRLGQQRPVSRAELRVQRHRRAGRILHCRQPH